MIDPDLYLQLWHLEHEERIAATARLAAVSGGRPRGGLTSLLKRISRRRRQESTSSAPEAPRFLGPAPTVLAAVCVPAEEIVTTAPSGRREV